MHNVDARFSLMHNDIPDPKHRYRNSSHSYLLTKLDGWRHGVAVASQNSAGSRISKFAQKFRTLI